MVSPGIEQVAIATSGDTAEWLHEDQLGSVRLATAANTAAGTLGAKIASQAFDPYGKQATSPTPTGTQPLLGYQGQYLDQETGLIYLRARYYDPATGQFVSVDPAVSATGETYQYAGSDPLNDSDVTGLCWPASACHFIKGLVNSGKAALHVGVDLVTDVYYLEYWGALDLNGVIHTALGRYGRFGCDLANVIGAPLVVPEAEGLGVDVAGDLFKQHVLHIKEYDAEDEGIPSAYLLGSQLGPPAHRYLGINWRHSFPGVHKDGTIDWWW